MSTSVLRRSGWAPTGQLPDKVTAEAFDILTATVGNAYVKQLAGEQPQTLHHLVRVGGIVMHCLRRAGFLEATVLRGGRMGVVHDIGKLWVAGISDQGVWTAERRQKVRAQHTRFGHEWAMKHKKTVPDPVGLALVTGSHHRELPRDYQRLDKDMAQAWGLVHLIQGADRFDALTSRAYVADREGALSASQILDLVFRGSPDTHHLPEVAVLDNRQLNLRSALKPLYVKK